ncbi:Na+/H+ antiporter [Kineosporia sp. R_H_3]|uniref:Na+/H+ antiporter n=1 Tax=Kineosporia sp. R_H_3 TaxID=1961848 RepID=UPI000B4B32D4|nr:Na+/H+ antiporter [Kineosporia sp. R_H_3]
MVEPFEIVALIAGSAAVAGVASRWGLSSPLVLTVVGIAVSFVPGVPEYPLSPEVALVGFLPPLLYAASIRTPFVDMRRNRRPIGLLSVALVLATAFAVAGVAMLVLPDLPFAAALALGAIVAPPDAVAATAVARQVGMPRKVVTILEGESLLNDATALVTLRMAVAALAGSVTLVDIGTDFLRAVVLGLLGGWLVAEVASVVRRRVSDPVLDTTLSFVVPYSAYLVAEKVHGSGVLAVVVAGLILGHRSPEIQSAASRVTERTIWRTVTFLLESVVFVLIGLQLRELLMAANDSEDSNATIAWFVLAIVLTVVVSRIVWMYPATYLPRLLPGVRRAEPEAPSWRHVALVSWAGMRGVVTLAAAFSLDPQTPHREVILIAAFGVVAGTLLVQGTTLPAVVRLLGVRGPDQAQDALQQALVMQRAVEAGRDRLDEVAGSAPADIVVSLKAWGERLAHSVWERLGRSRPDEETPAQAFRRLRVEMLQAERSVVVTVHRSGKVAAEVLEGVMERLDQEEALLASFTAGSAASDAEILAPHSGDACQHLRDEPIVAVPTSDTDECEDCVAIGERTWVALRMCLRCGHVACCDSSPNRHAEAHFHATSHPVMRSVELGEAWRWCYVDSALG